MRGGAPAILAILWAIAAAAAPLPSSPAWVSISSEDLQQNYDTLWAVSDVHGRRKQLEKLLVAAGIAVRSGGEMGWKPAQGRQLFIVVGDCIRGGPDSRGVVLLLKKLQDEAAAAGSRVVVLLGNKEVEFLADPLRFREDEFSRLIRTMPVAAVVGAHQFPAGLDCGAVDLTAQARLVQPQRQAQRVQPQPRAPQQHAPQQRPQRQRER